MGAVAVQTGVQCGPWRMPQRAQTMLMNFYAGQQGIKIEYIIIEGIFYHFYPRVRMVMKTRKIDEFIFTSVHQIPVREDAAAVFVSTFDQKVLHFALEGISGMGNVFIQQLVEELNFFHKHDSLMTGETRRSYRDFSKMLV